MRSCGYGGLRGRESFVEMLTMRQLMYAPVEKMRGLPVVDADTDPLWVVDMLDEAELMDVLIDVRREYAGVLFHEGGALYQEVGNAYLVVARQLQNARWWHPMGMAPGTLGAHYLGGSQVRDMGSSIAFACMGLFGGRVLVEGTSLSFYALDMPGMDLPMPLYDGEDVEAIEAGVASFDKAARPLTASHRWASDLAAHMG